MRIGSLFTGTGGLDLAAVEHFGGSVAWHADLDPGSCRLLAHHWPGTPNLGDITAVDWSAVEPVDVLTGGFPCQDVSSAGNRAGLREGTRSGLWLEMARIVGRLRPGLVLIENVRGLLSAEAVGGARDLGCEWCDLEAAGDPTLRALGAVLGDLAGLGYDARWCGVRASDVGAPHHRFRVFILASDARGGPHRRGVDERGGTASGGASRGPGGRASEVADAADDRRQRAGRAWAGRAEPKRGDHTEAAANTHRPGVDTVWGAYEPAIRRWEIVLGRPVPRPTIATGKLSPHFVEWMMGLPAGHVTDVPGLRRGQMLKLLGNGVVPQQARHALDLMTR